MAGWNNRNCCCETKAYVCGDGEVNICCMTLQASTWARALSAYAHNTEPDSICGYVVSPFPHNNVCGSVSSFNACDSLPSFRIFWGIQSDGTVTLRMELYPTEDGSGNYVPLVFHSVTGLDPDTWYLSPVVFTVSGVTYTIEVCPDPHEPFPEWPLTGVFYELRDSIGAVARSTGNVLCGENCDPSFYVRRLSWRYNVYTDEITISIFVQVRTGPFMLSNYTGTIVVPYDDGNWVDSDYTASLTAPGVADLSVSVLRVGSCTIPPPPGDCDPFLCYPLCVANTCPDDPETVNASAVYITASDGITEYDADAAWYSGEYTFSVALSEACGTLSGRIYCDGTDIKVDFDLFDGFVHTYATFTVDWECVDGDVSWTTPTPVSGITCALNITLWTNNNGGG